MTGQHASGYQLRYEFKTLSGAAVSGKILQKADVAVGGTIPIVYHRDDPRRNARYPLSLVTPAQR